MPSLAATAGRFIDHCRYSKSLSPHTTRAYAQDLTDFRLFVGNRRSPKTITKVDVEAFVQDLRRRSLSAATTKRRLGCLKVFFHWLQSTSLIGENPLASLKLTIKQPRRLPRGITRADLRSLVKQASKVSVRRDNTATDLAILLMATTGIRVAELVAIRTDDVEILDGCIRVHGKGNRERTVYVTNPSLLNRLKAHLMRRQQDFNPDGVLFVNRRGFPLTAATFRAHLKQASNDSSAATHVTPHMLRHTAATLLIEQGVDIRVVQRLLGHQSITTTEIYTHVADMTLRKALVRADLAAKIY